MPRGFGYGPGMSRGWQAREFGYGLGFGANFSPNCRFYPWLPRRWWATNTYQGVANAPYPYPAGFSDESEYLQTQAQLLKTRLGVIEKHLEQLGKQDTQNQG